jgi:hypothetical protein
LWAIHAFAMHCMKDQAFLKLVKVNWRVMPFFDSVSCHVGKSFDTRSDRSAGWSAENIMLSGKVCGGCGVVLEVAREADFDRNPKEGANLE